MADRIDFYTTPTREKEKEVLVCWLTCAAPALVEPGQQRSGEVTSVAFTQKTTCKFAFFPYNGVCCPSLSGVYFNPTPFVEILGWSVPIDSTLRNF